jgi:hypothetical protein
VSAPARCADLSELGGEPIGATATTAEHWLLIEAPGTWPRDVSDGEGLPERARRAARAWLERTPSSRLMFIRRPARTRDAQQLAFVVRAGETARGVRRLELAALEELGDVDEANAAELNDVPLVLVCGHGTRDACCAQRGTAVYSALAASLDGEQLWISSHQGGHRFAANILVLPAGVQLGRVSPATASTVVERTLAGCIDLDHLRGRTAYPAPAQAADIAIRQAAGLAGIDELRLLEVDGDHVRFRDSSGREHVAVVEQRRGPSVPASCGAVPEPQLVISARVV